MAEGCGDFLDIAIRWHDATAHGSVLSRRLEETVRSRLYPRTWAQLAPEMEKEPRMRRRMATDALARIVLQDRESDTHRRIVADPALWRPNPDLVRIDAVDIVSEACGSRTHISITEADCAALRHWARTGQTDHPALLGISRMIASRLAAASFCRSEITADDNSPLMIGHACVSWSDGDLRLWTDPFIRPKRLRYPAGQQPLSPLDAPESDHAILVTHCHPDHFDPASLLLFPATTTIIVPKVEHETPLTFDMALRARQLGFADVRTLAWGETCVIGHFTITALPFYGEQPLGADATPNARTDRNMGSTYHVVGPGGLTALFLADAGADPSGSSLQLARRLRRSMGRVDLLFGNHRRWFLYPPQFVTTSVPQNVCYVPDEELAVPQLMMLTPEQLTEIGEILSARHVIPYAMGNAPWFAEIGLGPSGAAEEVAGAFDAPIDAGMDDDPHTLVRPAAERTVLTAGDRIRLVGVARDDGMIPIDPAAFSAAAPQPPYCALAMGITHPQTLRDLIQLTRVDPASYLVAAPEFVEIATTDPKASSFLWELVARLVGRPKWTTWSVHPLFSGPFAQDPAWLRRFETYHHQASQALRYGDDVLSAIQPHIDMLRASSEPAAIEAIARDVLGLTLSLPRLPRSSRNELAGMIALPPEADCLIATNGRSQVIAALMLVKLVHNVVLTMQALGLPQRHGEAEAFSRLLPGSRVLGWTLTSSR